jgi:hypothetical protein
MRVGVGIGDVARGTRQETSATHMNECAVLTLLTSDAVVSRSDRAPFYKGLVARATSDM